MGIYAMDAHSQEVKVSIVAKNMTVKEILHQIEEKTEYLFLYNQEEVDVTRRTSMNVKKKKVSEILSELFGNTDIRYVMEGDNIVLMKQSTLITTVMRTLQDDWKVSGIVTDEKGESLAGVNISIKGTATGVISDINGKYEILVSDKNSTLVFSFIGYTTKEIVTGDRIRIDVILGENSQELEEIIVIGYGIVKKSDLTGSVTRVKADQLSNLPVSSIDKAIQGRAAGVYISSTGGTPGAGTSIRIRGGNSISADNEPLYVIDGFIGGGDLKSINPADIESIEILKDATATSIYGSRGANGVILITTKRGKVKSNKVNLNVYQGYQSLPRKLPYMNGHERAQFANAYAEFTNAPLPFPDMNKVQDTDWQDVITRVAPISDATVSISGGTDDFQHFISANYYNQEGIFKSSGFSRYQTRINLDKILYGWLKFGVNINASSLHTDNPKVDFYNGIRLALTSIPVYNENEEYVYRNPIDGQLFNNPKAMNDLLKTDTYSKRFLGSSYVEIHPVKDLVVRATLGGDYLFSKTERYEPGLLPTRAEQQKGGLARLDYQDYFSILNENTVNYMFNIDHRHAFSIFGGFTIQKEKTSTSYTKIEGFSNDIMEYNKLSAGDPSTVTYDSNATENQMLSYLGRVNYTLLNRYLLTLVARYDGSSRLAQNHKWAFFPSAALAWRLGEEDFIKETGLFHHLKLRTSYGLVGNQAIATYQSLASLNVVNPTFGESKQTGYLLGNISNPNLKWETTTQFDIGIEAAFFQGKLSLEFDYYHKITKDLLMNIEIPWTSGYKTQLRNIGKVRNQGVELLANVTLVNNRTFQWDVNVNISHNSNNVLDIADADYIDVQKGVRLYKNKPAAVFVGSVYEGTWKSQDEINANPAYMPGARPGTAKFKDVNNNQRYDGVGDYEILGDAEADFFGGFGTNFKYKKFDLELFFQGNYGNEILNPAANYLFFGDFSSNLFKSENEPWSESNSTSNVLRPGAFPYNVNVNNLNYSPSVQDGSYLKLKTLKIGYSLSPKQAFWLTGCNFYILFNNLMTWTNYKWGYDPDITGTHSVARGIDDMSYPQYRSVQIGFNVEF
jgi:TonB-linked SusC/RagA family outer membrane protein